MRVNGPCTKKYFSRFMIGGLAAFVLQLSPVLAAAEPIKLKVADWLPGNNHVSLHGTIPWLDDLKSRLSGEIVIEYYPAEQLGKARDMVTLAQNGVADIVHISPAYISEKFPLTGVAELPGMFDKTCNAAARLMQLSRPGELLHENEFKPQGLRVLWAATLPPYSIVTTRRPVETLSDLRGLKLRTAGGAMDITASLTGAVPIKLTGPDVLPSLQRGTLDGMFAPLVSLQPFDWHTALGYMTTNVGMASFVHILAISEQTWQKLPASTQEVLTSASDVAWQRLCEWEDNATPEVIKELKATGMTQVLLKAEDEAKLEEIFTKTRERWAASLDKQGKPGTETLGAFTNNL